MEFIELSSLILADLAGAAMTLIFCIRYIEVIHKIAQRIH